MDPLSQKMRYVVETSEDHGTYDVVGETFSKETLRLLVQGGTKMIR